MTLVTGTSPVSSDTDANFRLFANAASALLNGTLVKTSDTGQMTFPYAGAKPAAINTVVGYEVFRFNDAQQVEPADLHEGRVRRRGDRRDAGPLHHHRAGDRWRGHDHEHPDGAHLRWSLRRGRDDQP